MSAKREDLEEEIDAEMEKNEILLKKLEKIAKQTKKGDTTFIRSQKHYKKTKMVLEELKGRNGTIGV